MSRWKTLFAIALVALLPACASSGGGGEEGPEDEYEEQLGRLLLAPLREGMDKILPKYRIALRRSEEQFATLYYESEWQDRAVTAEEQAAGVMEARQRVLIQGRNVGQTLNGEGEYRVTFTAQNQVRSQADPAWHPAPAPPSFFEHWRQVYNDLRLEVSTGVRR